jgi:acetylornithine deacetylase
MPSPLTIVPVDLAARLVGVPSPTGAEGEVGRSLVPILEALGLSVTLQPLPESPARFNVLALAGGEPEVALCTHLDVVPPHIPPHRDGDILYGRGACDAKGIIAAMVAAAERLRAAGERRFALLFVIGEETDSGGARLAVERLGGSGFARRGVIVGEPTDGRCARAQKGSLKAVLVTRGRAAHSSCPETGDSAVLRLLPILNDLAAADWGADPTLGAGTLNIGELHAGVRVNVVPAEARAGLMVRIVDSVAATEQRLRDVVGGRGEVQVSVGSEPQALHVPGRRPSVVVAFNTDVPVLRAFGPPVLCGPGSIRHAHADDEQVRGADLAAAVDTYTALVHELLAG